ncbi:MAG: ComEC/Rec2 family competence protein, partial [Saprospiraceae bacterium]
LLYDPYLLFNAGFQLSYAAVAGMVFFYPYFNRQMPDWPKPLGEFRKIFLIGFAAQLGTLPLSLFFFHQFPVYFWLAGWVVVLGGAIFLAGGAALVVLNSVSELLASWLGGLLYYLVWGMNQVVFFIQHLPGSLISGIWITGWVVALLYLAVGLMGAAFGTRQLKWAIAALGIFTVLGFCRLVRSYEQENQQQLVIYSISKHRLIDSFDGRCLVSLSDSLTKKQVVFAAQPNRWALGTWESTTHFLPDTNFKARNCCFDPPFFGVFDRKMAIIDDARWVAGNQSISFPVDLILLSNNPKVSIADCVRQFPCQLIVWDGTNSWKQCERWRSECATLGLSGYDIRSTGAFVWTSSKSTP